MKTNVIVAIGQHPKIHPVGTEAIHESLGWVAVLRGKGNERQVRSFRIVEDPDPELLPGEDPESVLFAYRIFTQDVWVCFSTLRFVADPDRSRPDRLRMTHRSGGMFRLPEEQLTWHLETPEQALARRARNAPEDLTGAMRRDRAARILRLL